jgi:hypothetical protein
MGGLDFFFGGDLSGASEARPEPLAAVDAIVLSALAAFVDYLVVPKRLTPGWEKVVTPPSIGLAYGDMAVALWACYFGAAIPRGSQTAPHRVRHSC